MAKPVRAEFQFGQRVLESEALSVTWWCTETIVHTWASCMVHWPLWRGVCQWPSLSQCSQGTRCQPETHNHRLMHTCPKHSYYATEPAQNEPQAQEGDILLENKIQLFILVKTSPYFDLQPPLLFPPQKNKQQQTVPETTNTSQWIMLKMRRSCAKITQRFCLLLWGMYFHH